MVSQLVQVGGRAPVVLQVVAAANRAGDLEMVDWRPRASSRGNSNPAAKGARLRILLMAWMEIFWSFKGACESNKVQKL